MTTGSAALFAAPDATWLAGGHRRRGAFGGTDVWLTPPYILRALGAFDLDPCAAPDPRPWPTAARHIALPEDGLRAPWLGRCWVNPPYTAISPWLAKLADHEAGGTALIFARTETLAFQAHVFGRAAAVLFLAGRLTFCKPNGQPGKGNAGAPSVLVAYGDRDARALRESGLPGAFVDLSRRLESTP